MTDLDPELRQLMTLARQGLTPGEGDAGRVKALVSAALVGSEAMTDSRLARRGPWQSLAFLVIGMAVGGGVGFALGQRRAPQPPAIEQAEPRFNVTPAPLPSEPTASTPERTPPLDALHPPATPATLPGPIDAGRPKNSVPAQDPAAGSALIADEVALMKRVQRALARGEAAWALALLDQLDVQMPRGRLLEERASGRAIAQCTLEPSAGREILEGFANRHPRSVHLARVTQVCKPSDGQSEQRESLTEAPERGQDQRVLRERPATPRHQTPGGPP